MSSCDTSLNLQYSKIKIKTFKNKSMCSLNNIRPALIYVQIEWIKVKKLGKNKVIITKIIDKQDSITKLWYIKCRQTYP